MIFFSTRSIIPPASLGSGVGAHICFWLALLCCTRVLWDRVPLECIYSEAVVDGGLLFIVPSSAAVCSLVALLVSYLNLV